MDVLRSLIQDLERGKESAHQLRSLLQKLQGSDGGGEADAEPAPHDQDHHHYYKEFDDHSMLVLSTFDNALSVLQSCDFVDDLITGARKVVFTDYNDQSLHDCKSEEESGGLTPKSATPKDRRGCYKRRRIGQTATVKMTPNLTDDGFAWRKYGQKVILNTKHPRNYYRCTHKIDQGCQATKQVQQISENPTQYRIIYQGQHTCKKLLIRSPPILSDHQDSSFLLSFGTHTNPPSKHALNPLMLPSSPSSSSSSPFAMVKQEYYAPIKDQIPSEPSDPHHGTHNLYSSPSPDLTATSAPVSDQGDVISSSIDQGFYSPVAGFHGMDDDYSFMMADPIGLDAVMLGLLCV